MACPGTGSLVPCPHRPDISPVFSIFKEARRFKRRDLLGHSRRDELVDASPILPAQPFHCLLERAWQPQGIGVGLLHSNLTLPIASRGSNTSTPNRDGTTPKSRTLNVTRASAWPFTAASSTISSFASRS